MTLALHGKSRQRQWLLVVLGVIAVLGAVMAAVAIRENASADTGNVDLNPAHVGAVNSAFQQGSCPTPPTGQEAWYGWHFIMPANADFAALSVTFQSAGTFTANPFPGSVFVAHPDNSHAYIWTPTDDKLLSGTATYSSDKKNPPDFFNLSHTCTPGTTPPDPSVSVEKSHDPAGPFEPGDTFDWVVTVTVSGNATTDDTEISDQVDDRLEVLDMTGAGFQNCQSNANLVTCTLPEGSGIDEYELLITVRVVDSTDSCGVIPNAVSISGEDVDEANDEDEDSVTVNCEQTLDATYQVCKVITNDSAVTSGTFDITVGGNNIQLTVEEAGAEGIECDEVRTVEAGTSVGIVENNIGSWNTPEYEGNGSPIPQDDGISITPGPETCVWQEEVLRESLEVDDSVDCLVIIYNTHPETPRVPIEICKVFLDNADGTTTTGTEFDFDVTGYAEPITIPVDEGDEDCAIAYVALDTAIVIAEQPGTIVDDAGFPKVAIGTDINDAFEGDSINVTVIDFDESLICGTTLLVDVFDQRIEALENDVEPVCTITFWNQEEPGDVLEEGIITVIKYLDRNGDGDANDPGEGTIGGWTVFIDGVEFQTDANGEAGDNVIVGDVIPVSEETLGGYKVIGARVNQGGLQAGISNLNVNISGATTLVEFYNQPVGDINVHKDTIRRHNNGPAIPQPQDDDGWTIAVVSAQCNVNESKQTDAQGNASFEDLPLCDDYVVSENPVNPSSPGYTPQGPTSVNGVAPAGGTITFTNAILTFDPPCTNINQCGPVTLITPVPTNTPVPPTATPTNTPIPPTPDEDIEGEKTPGPATPIAPDTGSGNAGRMATGMNVLLVVAGLLALGTGLTVATAARRKR